MAMAPMASISKKPDSKKKMLNVDCNAQPLDRSLLPWLLEVWQKRFGMMQKHVETSEFFQFTYFKAKYEDNEGR